MVECTSMPRVHGQLNNGFPTGSFDCGVELTRTLINFASCNLVDIKEDVLRQRMGVVGPKATSPIDWKHAIEHPDTAAQFAAVGLQAPRFRLLSGVDFSIAEQDIQAGKMVGAAIWYADVNKFRSDLSGSRTFNDNHAMGLLGLVTSTTAGKTHRLATGYDSLRDGRGSYPKGTEQIPWWLVKQACGDVHVRTRDANGKILTERRLGDGKFLGGTIARAKAIVVVTPPETDAEAIARLTQALATAQTANAALAAQQQAGLTGLTTVQNWIAQQRAGLDDLEASIASAIQQAGGGES